MAILIFIIILSVLIVVHEVGHFTVAKKFGIRIDEFGLGYPPRAKKLFSWKGTDFTLNWLPFGGFVRIFGEDAPTEVGVPTEVGSDSFVSKNRGIQAAVLVAGVVANFIFAWFLISLGFMVGMPSSATESFPIENARTVITSVMPNSPAFNAGFEPGDEIVSATRGDQVVEESALEVAEFIALSLEPINFAIIRDEMGLEIFVTPEMSGTLGKPVIGVSMDELGIATLPPMRAVYQGLRTTTELTILTAQAIWGLLSDAVQGEGSLSGLTGPVGLVGIVGDVSGLGFAYLLSLTALISINLTLINLLPFPALDGGRLLMVFVEAVSRKKIPARVTGSLNMIGFVFLILLMVLVTVQDVRNIF